MIFGLDGVEKSVIGMSDESSWGVCQRYSFLQEVVAEFFDRKYPMPCQ
jgi:hypothetical protein